MGKDKYENGSPQELRKENALLYIILCKKDTNEAFSN